MERKNIGQKVIFERFFDSISLLIQRLKWSVLGGLVLSTTLFHFLIGLKYLDVPIGYFFLSFANKYYDPVFKIIFDKSVLKKKLYYHRQMNDLILNYELATLFSFVIFSALIFFIMTKYFRFKGKKLNNDRHYRGLKIVSKNHLKNDIKDEINSKETGLKYTEKDFYIGKEKIRIPRSLGANMWAYLGNAGTGKSFGIFNQLLQIREHQEKVMVVDPGGEYYKYFGKKTDVVLSLYDVRSEYYSFWHEGLTPLRIAQSLIEEINGNNEFWTKAAQALFAGLLELNSSSEDMYKMLFLDYDVLKNKLKERQLAAGVVLGEAEQAGGVLSSAVVDLAWLGDMNHWAKKCGRIHPFSINKWVKDDEDRRWVFLTCSDKHWTISKHLIRLWTDIAVLACFERGACKNTVPVWLVCDEISSIGKLPSMSLLEDRGRKYNMGLIAGFQTPSQLEAIYGKSLAKVIIQGLQNQVCFRSNEQEMLEYMSSLCGEAEYIQTNSSRTFGAKNGETASEQIIRKRNVLPDEFRSLKNMNAYLKIAGHNPTKIRIDYLNLPEVNEPDLSFIPKCDAWDGTINGIKITTINQLYTNELKKIEKIPIMQHKDKFDINKMKF